MTVPRTRWKGREEFRFFFPALFVQSISPLCTLRTPHSYAFCVSSKTNNPTCQWKLSLRPPNARLRQSVEDRALGTLWYNTQSAAKDSLARSEETGIEILLALFEAMRSPDSAADVECDGAALGSAILGSAARGATIAAFLFPRPLVYLTSMPKKK